MNVPWRPPFSIQLPPGTTDTTTYLWILPQPSKATFVVRTDFVGSPANPFQYMIEQRQILRRSVENLELIIEDQESAFGYPACMQQVTWNAPGDVPLRQVHRYIYVAGRGLMFSLCATAGKGVFDALLPQIEELFRSFRIEV